MIGELVFHIILFIGMIVLFRETYNFPILNIGGKLSAVWWPRIVLGLGMVLIGISALIVVAKKRRLEEKRKAKITKKEIASLFVSTGLFLGVLLLVNVLGFIGAIPFLFLGFMYQLGCRKHLSLLLVPVISTLVFALMFGNVMEVPLPRGQGIMRLLSFYLY